MIRGATTQFNFVLPRKVVDIASVKIVFWQESYFGPAIDRKLPITKVLGQCSMTDDPNELTVILNQEETLRFIEDRKAYVQIKAVATDGLSYTGKKRAFTVYPVYDDNILGDEVIPTPDPDGLIFFDGGEVKT